MATATVVTEGEGGAAGGDGAQRRGPQGTQQHPQGGGRGRLQVPPPSAPWAVAPCGQRGGGRGHGRVAQLVGEERQQ